MYGTGSYGNPDKSSWRKQVQLSMNQREFDELSELIELVKKERTKEGWHPDRWRNVTRSSVVVDLIRADLRRRKAATPPDPPKTKRAAT